MELKHFLFSTLTVSLTFMGVGIAYLRECRDHVKTKNRLAKFEKLLDGFDL